MASNRDERSPLLQNGDAEQQDEQQQIQFSEKDTEDPRAWPKNRKLANVAVIASMSILSPLASSMFTPGIPQIAEGLLTDEKTVIGATTGFVVMLGVGPLILAPLSETFGRRKLYLICFSLFTLLQIPTALSPNIATLLALRTISGFFGAVGIANGGGTISDMFPPQERAGVFGWYLLGPLLGPTLGPLFGGVTVQRLGWRWIFWILTIVCGINTLSAFFFLRETYAPVLLAAKKKRAEEDDGPAGGQGYWYEGEDTRPFWTKIGTSLVRPIKIFSQPIVVTMSIYQALIFSTTYSLYTNFQGIYGKQYGFSTEQVGLMYLGPGIGFVIAVWFLVPQIDVVYNRLAEKNDGNAKPEHRLPMANIGAILIPISLFWFAWAVQARTHWLASIASTPLYGLGQVMIINCTQNYYIDSFEKYAASAIAAGAVFRSIIGGVVPLFVPGLLDSVGYGWGISVFAFIGVALAPAPMVFYKYGAGIREKFAVPL